jgi:transposase
MLHKKDGDSKIYYNISLDSLVPRDHLLRIIDKHIDFDFIHTRVRHLYSHTGQPAIDPIVIIKMLFIGYLYDIKSERQLEKEIQVNLAYRWFIHYDLDETIPDHSTISQTRRRKFNQSSLFQDIFDEIVRQCIERGLIRGETLLTDSTHIKANASMESLREIVITPQEYIKQLDSNTEPEQGLKEQNKSGDDDDSPKKCSNDTHRSKSDPESRLFIRKGKPKGLYYLEHRTIDFSGFITDVYITPGNITDNIPYLDRLKSQIIKFQLETKNAVADRAYGTTEIYKALTDMNIDAYIPQQNFTPKRDGMYRRADYIYDAKTDSYQCPAGNTLVRSNQKTNYIQENIYSGKRSFCNSACPGRSRCLQSKNPKAIKTISRKIHQECVDAQLAKKGNLLWKKFMRRRKTILEGSFAEAKNHHRLGRTRFRGTKKVQEQSLMIATVQNIKKMIKYLERYDMAIGNMINQISNKCFSAITGLRDWSTIP